MRAVWPMGWPSTTACCWRRASRRSDKRTAIPKSKRPGRLAGPFVWKRGLPSGRPLGDDLVAFRLGTAARALGERRLDLLHGLGLGEALHRRDLARQPVECCLVELALRVGLLGLAFRPIEVAHHFRDGDDVAGIDLGLVF